MNQNENLTTQARADFLQALKETEEQLNKCIEALGECNDVDKRSLSIAKTHIETGMLWMQKALAV